jgi:hypothetical protein
MARWSGRIRGKIYELNGEFACRGPGEFTVAFREFNVEFD